MVVDVKLIDGRGDLRYFRKEYANFAQVAEVVNSFNVALFKVIELHIYQGEGI